MSGEKLLREWASEQTLPTDNQVGAAYLFAHYPGGKLPIRFYDGISSAVAQAGFDSVQLLYYKKPSNVPDGVVEVDASIFLPEERFKYLLTKGFKVVHLSDWVRVMAMEATTYKRAVFVDGDTIWVKKALPEDTHFGFWTATFRENPVG